MLFYLFLRRDAAAWRSGGDLRPRAAAAAQADGSIIINTGSGGGGGGGGSLFVVPGKGHTV